MFDETQESRQENPNSTDTLVEITCPNCGRQTSVKASTVVTQCEFCTSGLRPTAQSLEQYYIGQSKLPHAIPATEIKKAIPWLANLIDGTSFKSLGEYSPSHTLRNLFNAFSQSYRPIESQDDRKRAREVAKKTIEEKTLALQELVQLIQAIPDKMWRVIPKKEEYSYGQEIYVPIIHDSGKMTLLKIRYAHDIENQMYDFDHGRVQTGLTREQYIQSLQANDTYWDIKVSFIRLSRIPNTKHDFEKLLGEGYYSQDKAVEAHGEIPYWSMNTYLSEPTTGFMSDRPVREDGVDYVQLAKSFDVAMITQISQLLEKGSTIFAENSNKELLLDSPQDSNKTLEVTEYKQSPEAISLACSSCGKNVTIENFDASKSFAECPSCSNYIDLVKSGKINKQHLEAESVSETLIPAEYFLQLLLEQSINKGQSPETFFSVLNTPKEGNMYFEELVLADVFTNIALNNPQLLSRYEYRHGSDSYYGFGNGSVMFIEFPKGKTTIASNSSIGNVEMHVPEELVGKTVCITFGEHGDDSPYSSDEWYRVQVSILEASKTNTLDQQFQDVGQWAKRHFSIGRSLSNHWIEGFNRSVSREISGDTRVRVYGLEPSLLSKVPREGELFTRIKKLLEATPPNQKLQEQLKHK